MATNENMDTTSAGNEDERKLFAGGLPQDAKEAQIREHFGQFGEIESVTLKTDMATGRSRGFCFIVYKTVDGLEKAVASEHTISNKKVAVKKAQAKQGKVYIGKLPAEVSDDEIKNHMATFGTIANIEQPFDKVTNLIIYRKCVRQPYLVLVRNAKRFHTRFKSSLLLCST